jgi:predicted TIM-barrel fold metal-dependent hydrolase
MTRHRSDTRRQEQDTKRLKRENSRLLKQVRQLNSLVPDGAIEEEDVKEKLKSLPPTDIPCSKCGASTEIFDIGIRKYYQCTKDRTHRTRA